jgi:D-3-phosphoglycerate dehydrogenase / 2-oxoglutarate reductase
MKIVVAEKVAPSCLAVFKEQSDWTVVSPEKDALAAELAEADALLVRSAVFVDAAMMDKAPKLRVIGRAGVGVDNIDLDAATKRGIAVMNTPGGNAIAVAEHTLALMLALARHLTLADSTTHAGKWEKKSLQGTELRAKTLGIVGLGKVGMEVAKRAQSFGMKVVAHDPFVAASLAQQLQITLVPLEELFAKSDYITLHVGLTPQTQGMISAATLAKMKKGTRLVNCARGELLDDAAVVAALESRQLGGAALDVFRAEPLKDSPYHTAPNVILTPHIAGSTNEAQDAVGVQIAMQVREYLLKGVIQNAVNVPSVTFEEYEEMLPYIGLAERLGTFLAQSGENGVEEITIAYGGDLSEWKTDLIRNAAVAGVLNQMAHEKANLVNARSIAEERGIRVNEHKNAPAPRGSAINALTVSLKTHQQTRAVLGTVLHGSSPRLLRIDEIDVEAPLKGNIIYLRNRDVPGVIGRVGTVLGQHNVNIANFSLGRAEDGKEPRGAVAVVQVDSEINEAVLQDLRKIDAVEVAKAIRF